MKHINLFKAFRLILLVTLLAAMMAIPAIAQEPVDEGEFSIQQVGFSSFAWDPPAARLSRSDGSVTTRLNVTGAHQIAGMTLAIAYPSFEITPFDIQPGALLPGVEGQDYIMIVTPGGGGLACGGDTSFTVNIVYFNPTMTINGSGSLVEIEWRNDPAAFVNSVATTCLDGATSAVVDNGGLSGPPVPNTFGTITIDPFNLMKFYIGLEGGKSSGLVVGAVPENIYTSVIVNGGFPCTVDADGYCAFNFAVAPPYNVDVYRIGYRSPSCTFADIGDSNSIYLTAGDLNGDDEVNIFDLVLAAGLIGQPVGLDTLSNAADYNGDWVISITDLVFVAKNYESDVPACD